MAMHVSQTHDANGTQIVVGDPIRIALRFSVGRYNFGKVVGIIEGSDPENATVKVKLRLSGKTVSVERQRVYLED